MSNKFNHEHGEIVTVDCDDPKTQQCLNDILKLHESGSAYLQVILVALALKRKVDIPCKQCMRDIALQFKDMGSLIEELIGDKCQK